MYQILKTYLNPRLRCFYFRFLKTNGRHIEILLPVSIFTFSLSVCHQHAVFHQRTKFHRNRFISRWRPSAMLCWICFRVIVAHPRSASGGVCFILKFRLDRIYSFGDGAIFIVWHFGLKLRIHAHF